MTWHTLERHLFPTERGRNILHSQTTKLLSLLPVLGRLTHSKQIQPQLSCSCSEGTSAHFTHRNKALPPGGDETVGIKTVLKYVLQNIYREIWLIFFFSQKNAIWGIGGASSHQTDMELSGRHAGSLRITVQYPQWQAKDLFTTPSKTGYLFSIICVFLSCHQSSPFWDATEPLGWSLVNTGSAGNRIMQAV